MHGFEKNQKEKGQRLSLSKVEKMSSSEVKYFGQVLNLKNDQ